MVAGAHIAALAAVALLANPTIAIPLNSWDYCIKYFGSVVAELEMPDTLPEFSNDGETVCPKSYNFPRTQGAMLRLCPPLASSHEIEGRAMELELYHGHTMGELNFPVDHLRLRNVLITNGSVSGPYENGGDPAILAADPKTKMNKDWRALPAWRINGTQKSLIEDATPRSSSNGIYFSCLNMDSPPRYCVDESGCWTEQSIQFSMLETMNFTVLFSNTQAEVEIFAHGDWNATGGSTIAKISFAGSKSVPTVTDYEFWNHYDQESYEVAMEYENDENVMGFKTDERDFPLFVNMTESEEWYAAGNGTFFEGAATGLRVRGLWFVVTVIVGFVLVR